MTGLRLLDGILLACGGFLPWMTTGICCTGIAMFVAYRLAVL